MHDVDAQSNAFEDLGKVLFLAMDDILCEYDIPPIGVLENWEDLSPERQAFLSTRLKTVLRQYFSAKSK